MQNKLNINHNNLKGGLWLDPSLNLPFNEINQTGLLLIGGSSQHFLEQTLHNHQTIVQFNTSLILWKPIINFGQYQLSESQIIGLSEQQSFVNKNRLTIYGSDFIDTKLFNSGRLFIYDEMRLFNSTIINNGFISSKDLFLMDSSVKNFSNFELRDGLIINQIQQSDFENYGTFSGEGTIITQFNNSGEINPGDYDDYQIGELWFDSGFSSNEHSKINIEMSERMFDRIQITGLALLNGTLNISLLEGFLPNLGQTFEIVTYYQLDSASQLDFTGLTINEQFEFLPKFSENSLSLIVIEKSDTNPLAQSLTVTIEGKEITGLLESYGGSQDTSASIVNYNNDEVELLNNTWKTLNIGNYSVTRNTMLSFEFRSKDEGEIQGIGLDNDDSLTNNNNKRQMFKLYGTQRWGNQAFDDYQGLDTPDGWKNYQISLGQYFTGDFDRLVFFNDNDTLSNMGASSQFRNITLIEI